MQINNKVSGDGTCLTKYHPNPQITGEISMQSACSNSLDFHREKTTVPIVITRTEYSHLDKFHRCICDAAVAEGDFFILEK